MIDYGTIKEPVCILEAIITPANAEAAKPTYGISDKMADLITLRIPITMYALRPY